jgi:hypothetical protein
MATTRVRIMDVTGSRSQVVEAPDDVPIERLMVVLIERMHLPLHSPDGQIMSYKLHHKRSGRQLLEDETLGASGVLQGDDLRLQPEITAGRGMGILPMRGGDVSPPHFRKGTTGETPVVRLGETPMPRFEGRA